MDFTPDYSFNKDLWSKLDALNHENFKKKDFSRYDQWIEERHEPCQTAHCGR